MGCSLFLPHPLQLRNGIDLFPSSHKRRLSSCQAGQDSIDISYNTMNWARELADSSAIIMQMIVRGRVSACKCVQDDYKQC